MTKKILSVILAALMLLTVSVSAFAADETSEADAIVDGQQTMNPSSEDFIKAFDAVNADTIIVLPNNSNIVMAAKQAGELYKANMKNRNSVYLDRIIYSADVCVFRDDITYERVEPKFVDVITCPAPSAYIKSDSMALRIYTKRIKNIINSAILNDVECLVLGAWGCGAFCQDPRLVSAAFVSVLNEYSGAFKKIVFAFRHTPGMESSSDYTPQVFLNEFNANYKWGVNDGLR